MAAGDLLDIETLPRTTQPRTTQPRASDSEQGSEETLHVMDEAAMPDDAGETVLPEWMHSSKTFSSRWLPLRVRRLARSVEKWIKGPSPPHQPHIQPLWPNVQEAPLKFLDKYVSKRPNRIGLLLLLYLCWSLTWGLMLRHNSLSGFIEGYGKPSNIWCGASFWSEGSGCGLNGNNCRPFSSANLVFRCPANCDSVHLHESRIVGNQSYIYHDFVVGGSDPSNPKSSPIYRADSFICQAAIHAGIISGSTGGCGVATLSGSHLGFAASMSQGIQSIDFAPSFPRSFTFQNLEGVTARCPSDSRWPLLAVTATFLTIVWLFTISPATLFLSTFFIVALHVGLVSDPPTSANFHELLSTLASRLLPSSFVAYVLYRFCAWPTLAGVTAQVEKTVLYLGFVFIGALNNHTFAPLIPIQRLTPTDIASQPGAPLALTLIIIIILTIVGTQIHTLRMSGLLPRYLKIYICILTFVLVLLVLPGWRLRIHHYILALVFFPGTAIPTRPSLIYQGLLLGLFINGVMRWGFASIIQTPAALGEGGGHSGSWWGATSPNITAAVGLGGKDIRFDWGELPSVQGIDGVSILVDDVERWRGYVDDELFWNSSGITIPRRKVRSHEGSFVDEGEAREEDYQELSPLAAGKRDPKQAPLNTLDANGTIDWGLPQFYRFAWINGASTGRYGGVGIWNRWGDWEPIRMPSDETGKG